VTTVRNLVQDLFGDQPGASDWLVVDTTGNPADFDWDVSDWTGSTAGAYRDWVSQQKAAVGGMARGAETLAAITEAQGCWSRAPGMTDIDGSRGCER
jgi:hypothetical protein